MAKNNNKVYNTPKRVTKGNSNNSVKTKKNAKKKVSQNTTRIRIDTERLNDLDSLDTSFLEGRMGKKTSRRAKEKILSEKRQIIDNLDSFKKILYLLSFLCILIILITFVINSSDFFSRGNSDKNKIIEKDDTSLVDRNYLFIGDFYSEGLSYDNFNVPLVKTVNKDYTSQDILNNIKEYIYDYNPSLVFIEIGMNDLEKEIEVDDISNNIESIIKGIMKNRPYSKIYVESIYPINDIDFNRDVYNNIKKEQIIELNNKLKKICEKEKINYLDIYNILSFNDQLRSKYTIDGINLNEVGYSVLEKKLKEVVDENEKTFKEEEK